MAAHVAEQILAAVTGFVTGLATTADRVTRARVYPLASSAVPALSIFMGPDVPIRDDEPGALAQYIDSQLEILIVVHVRASSGIVDTTLNQIRKEVAVALHTNYQLGLAGNVYNTIEGNADEPELSGTGEKRTARQTLHYFVKYRRSRNDPST